MNKTMIEKYGGSTIEFGLKLVMNKVNMLYIINNVGKLYYVL